MYDIHCYLQIANRFENEGHNVSFTSFRTEVIATIQRVVFIAMEVTTPSLTTLSSLVSERKQNVGILDHAMSL